MCRGPGGPSPRAPRGAAGPPRPPNQGHSGPPGPAWQSSSDQASSDHASSKQATMSNRIREIGELGQAIWLDYISRDLLDSGELRQLVNEGIRSEERRVG